MSRGLLSHISLCRGTWSSRCLLLHLLREARESGEDEESCDCEISDGLVYGFVPFVRGLHFVLHPEYERDHKRLQRNYDSTRSNQRSHVQRQVGNAAFDFQILVPQETRRIKPVGVLRPKLVQRSVRRMFPALHLDRTDVVLLRQL